MYNSKGCNCKERNSRKVSIVFYYFTVLTFTRKKEKYKSMNIQNKKLKLAILIY